MTPRTLRCLELLWQKGVLNGVEHVLGLSRVLFRVHDARAILPNQVQLPLPRALGNDIRGLQDLRLAQRDQHARPILSALTHHHDSRVQLLAHAYMPLLLRTYAGSSG